MLENLPIHSMPNSGLDASRLLPVKVGTHVRMLVLDSVVHVQAAGNYVGISLVDGGVVHTKETISHIAERLPQPKFVRIHRSVIVNRAYVREIQPRQNHYEFILANDVHVLSGITFRKQVREQFLTSLKCGARSPKNPLVTDSIRRPVNGDESPLAAKTRIRRCAPGDEYNLAQLGKITFLETYSGVFSHEDILVHCVTHDSPGVYRAWLEDGVSRIWVAEMETCRLPVGYVVVTPPNMPYGDLHPGDLEIQRLYVSEHFHGGGLDRQLLAMAMRYAEESGGRRLLLGEYCGNEVALAFFRREGFCPLGEYTYRVGARDYPDIILGLEL